jgi:hypothetical protein
MKGLALAVVGLWVILQTTYGPLATKLGLISGTPSAGPQPGSASTPAPGAPDYGIPGMGGPTYGASPSGPNLGTGGGGGTYGASPSGPNLGTGGPGVGLGPSLGE